MENTFQIPKRWEWNRVWKKFQMKLPEKSTASGTENGPWTRYIFHEYPQVKWNKSTETNIPIDQTVANDIFNKVHISFSTSIK